MNREDLPDLMAFHVITEERSFRRAAVRLGVSASALSHAMRRLEASLGVVLLLRTTRSVAPTEAGRQLRDELEPALAGIARAVQALDRHQTSASGRVRIGAHREAALNHIAPKLKRLRRSHPGIVIEVVVDAGLVDVVAAGFDAGIRSGELLAKDMVAIRISPDQETTLVASPGYIAARGKPVVPEDLGAHDQIGYRLTSTGAVAPWRLQKNGRAVRIDVDPVFVSNDVDLMIEAAADGLGLAYVLSRQVEAALASGALVSVLDDWRITFGGDFLYHPSRRQMSPALAIVIDALRWRPAAA